MLPALLLLGAGLLIGGPAPALSADNGLALTPPLGWRSFNAFWGIVDQVKMETIMDAMVNTSRTVAGTPTSLLDLGYRHVGLDGGWNYCFPNNKTFHLEDGTPVWCDWAAGRPCQGNVSFPDPQHMVTKVKALGLSPGWCESRTAGPPGHVLLLAATDQSRPRLTACATRVVLAHRYEQLRLQRTPVRGRDDHHPHGRLRQGADRHGLGGPQA